MLRPTLRALAGAAALVAHGAACTASPPHMVATSVGIVRADDRESALRVGPEIVRMRAELAARLPGLRNVAVEVWVIDDVERGWADKPADVSAWVWHRASQLAPRIHIARDRPDSDLVHELVHAWLDESWSELPPALEEGLCDVVANEMVDFPKLEFQRLWCAARLGFPRTSSIPIVRGTPVVHRVILGSGDVEGDPSLATLTPAEVVELRQGELLDLALADRSYTYGIGYFLASRIVRRIGYEGLHALCVEARREGRSTIPPARIWREAQADPERLVEQAREDLRASWVRSLMADASMRASVAELVREGGPVPPPSLPEFLQRVGILVMIHGDVMFSLREHPAFVEWARANWRAVSDETYAGSGKR